MMQTHKAARSKQVQGANHPPSGTPFREDGKTYGKPTWMWAVVVDGDLYVRATL